MEPSQLRLVLRESADGMTHLSLTGALEPVPCAPEVKRLFALLASWTGRPLVVALCVDAQRTAWCEAWVDALGDVRPDHLEVQFTSALDAREPTW